VKTRKKTKAAHPLVRAGRVLRRQAKDHLLPHAGNGHVPHVLKHRALLGFGLALLSLKALVLAASLILPAQAVLSSAITAQNIVDLTNQTRHSFGLKALNSNPRLAQAAQARADDMMAKQYFSHTSPSGRTPWDFVSAAGYAYSLLGENLAVHYHQAEDVEAGWLASPTHRANIVNPEFKDIGIGVVRGTFEGQSSTIVVQIFGAPKIAGAIAGVKQKTELAYDPLSLSITPSAGSIGIQVTAQEALSVKAGYASTWIDLQRDAQGNWHGSLPSSMLTSARHVTILAQSLDGRDEVSTAASYVPGSDPRDLYSFGAKPEGTLFGSIDLNNLRDSARLAYLLVVLFLGACLLVGLSVKTKIRHPRIVAHTLAIIGLAFVLWRF